MATQFTPEIAAALKAPFAPDAIKWRVGRVLWNSTSKERGVKGAQHGDKGVAVVLAYVNTMLVKDRLDEVVGAAGWAFDFTPVTILQAEVMTAKGTLTILDAPPVSDIGEAGNNEKSKGAVRDALKRAAALRGVADYLAELGEVKANVTFGYAGWQIDDSEFSKLANYLPGPSAPAKDKPITPELIAILSAWYGDAASAKFATLSASAAIKLISSGVKPAPETAKAAMKGAA